MSVSRDKYLRCIEQIYQENPTYENGHDGSDGKCDCIGMVKGAIRRAGEVPKNLSGTNYAARFGINDLHRVSSASELTLGHVVLKARDESDSGYSLPAKYKKGGSCDTGDYLDYYHIGTVTKTDPLEITHMTSPHARKDSKLGAWEFAGELPQVAGVEPSPEPGPGPSPEPTPEPLHAVVTAQTGKTVNMRKSPNINSALVERVPIGATVEVLERGEEWSKVKYKNFRGYMMNRFLIFEEPTEMYTVIIPNLTLAQAEYLKSEYPDAEIAAG